MKSLRPSPSKSATTAPVCWVEPPGGTGTSPRLLERFCQTGSVPAQTWVVASTARPVSQRGSQPSLQHGFKSEDDLIITQSRNLAFARRCGPLPARLGSVNNEPD